MIRLLLLLVVSAGAAGILAQSVAAQTAYVGVEVRLAARQLADGSVAVGFQYRLDGEWSEVEEPQRNRMPGNTPVNAWRVSSTENLLTRQSQVHISPDVLDWNDDDGPGEFAMVLNEQVVETNCASFTIELSGADALVETLDSDCKETVSYAVAEFSDRRNTREIPIRLLARRLANGALELGLQQQTFDGEWGALERPAQPLLLSLGREWAVSGVLSLPEPPTLVEGTLRPRAFFRSVGGEMLLTVDGEEYETNCGWFHLDWSHDSLLVDTLDEQCVDMEALVVVCADDGPSPCDAQRNHVYQWESRHTQQILEIMLTLPEAQRVTDAIYGDYFPSRRAPRVFESTDDTTFYQSNPPEIHLADWGMTLGALLHEIGHGIIDFAGVLDAGHEGAFTAVLLDLWERYAPVVDISGTRVDGERASLEIDTVAPVAARSSSGVHTVGEIVCGFPSKSEEYCSVYEGFMPESVIDLEGRYVGFGGRDESFVWGAFQEEDSPDEVWAVVSRDNVASEGETPAKLYVYCRDGKLHVRVRWETDRNLDGTVAYLLGEDEWTLDEWYVENDPSDSDYKNTYLYYAEELVIRMYWSSQSEDVFTIESHRLFRSAETFRATFELESFFETPVQPYLASCGR